MDYAQRQRDGLLHTYFFQFRGKIKESTDDINKKIARLRLGQPYSNDERDKKMYGFFKKFLTLVSEYVDSTTLVAVGRVVNTVIGLYRINLNEKESEDRPNSPVPQIEHRYNVDVPTPHHEEEDNFELDQEMLDYIHEPAVKQFKDPNHQLKHELYQRHDKKLKTTPEYLDGGDRPDWNMDAYTPKDLLVHNVHLGPSKKVFEYSVKGPEDEKKQVAFSGVLEKGRCRALDHKTGEQCQNHPVIGIEYCWIHMRNYLNLEIRHTMQRDDNGNRHKLLGLFAVMGPYLHEHRQQHNIPMDDPIFEPNQKITPMTKEKKTMNTALQQYPKGQPPYAQAYPADHPNADTHIQEMAQIRSIAACVQHSAEHANTKIRQVAEEVDGHALRLMYLIATKPIHDGEELLLHFGDYTIDQTGEGVTYSTKQRKLDPQGKWVRRYNPYRPKLPVILEGQHVGQKYDKRYIPPSKKH